MKINVVVEGERSVYARIDAWNKKLVADIYATISSLTARLEAKVRESAPVGSDSHSGRLRSSITSKVIQTENRIKGVVTAPVAYAPVIEFGLHKQLEVRAHEMRLDHAWSRDIDPITVSVDPYTRMANAEATLFMQRALEAMSTEAADELRAAIDANSGEL